MPEPRPYELWSFQSAWNWACRWEDPQGYPDLPALIREFWGPYASQSYEADEAMDAIATFLRHRLGLFSTAGEIGLDYFMAMSFWVATEAA